MTLQRHMTPSAAYELFKMAAPLIRNGACATHKDGEKISRHVSNVDIILIYAENAWAVYLLLIT